MPNMRDAEKRMVGCWLLPAEIKLWDRIVKENGYEDRTDWVRRKLSADALRLKESPGRSLAGKPVVVRKQNPRRVP